MLFRSGYGYDDIGREVTEKVFAEVFKVEKVIVRIQIVNGTHVLSLILSGILRPGDEIIYISGKPYDTLEEVIGIRGNEMGSLSEFGITRRHQPERRQRRIIEQPDEYQRQRDRPDRGRARRLIGALGFLVFNINPAKIFMGDTESLALGGGPH